MEARLFLLQRLSAAVMAPLVLIHLGLILYAVEHGLSAEAILGRVDAFLRSDPRAHVIETETEFL